MAHAQKPDFVFWRNGRVHWNQRGHQFSWLLVAEVCSPVVVMVVVLDTPCSEIVWRVLATHTIHQFPLHFPSRASPYAITFQLDSTTVCHDHNDNLLSCVLLHYLFECTHINRFLQNTNSLLIHLPTLSFFTNTTIINPLMPNDNYSGRTAPLTSKHCILYIYSTNTGAEYFKHGIYSPFFPLQNAVSPLRAGLPNLLFIWYLVSNKYFPVFF